MPIDVFLMILGATLIHATWNALVKTDSDRLALTLVGTTLLKLSP